MPYLTFIEHIGTPLLGLEIFGYSSIVGIVSGFIDGIVKSCVYGIANARLDHQNALSFVL